MGSLREIVSCLFTVLDNNCSGHFLKGVNHMQKLTRKINMGFRVTEEERELIYKRMAQTGITNLRAYMLKQAIDGYVINLDLSEINECSRLLRTVSNNANQIAKYANTMGAVYAEDMASIQSSLEKVWQQQEKIIRSLAKIVEVA